MGGIGDVVLRVIVTILSAIVTVVLLLRLLASKDSKYPFDEADMGGSPKTRVRSSGPDSDQQRRVDYTPSSAV